MKMNYDDGPASADIIVKIPKGDTPSVKFDFQDHQPIPRVKIPAQPFNPAKRNKQYTPKK